MPLVHITDHAAQAGSLLLDQYKNKPRLLAWLLSYIGEVQAIEDAGWDTLVLRLIDNAEGAQLDTIGRLVGEERQGRDDPTYRRFIVIRIRVNRSKGFARDVFDVLALLDTAPREFRELRPATLYFEFAAPTVLPESQIFETLDETIGGGIGLVIVSPASADDIAFLHSSVGDADIEAHAYGDASAPSTTFGLLATALI